MTVYAAMTKGLLELTTLTPGCRVKTQAEGPLRGSLVLDWSDPRLGLAVVLMLSVQSWVEGRVRLHGKPSLRDAGDG